MGLLVLKGRWRPAAARPPAGPRATATACDVDTVRNYARANSVRMT